MGISELAQGFVVADRYVIDRTLGDGGMGIVYLAADLDNQARQVALKVLNAAFANNEARQRRFINEARYCHPQGGFLRPHANVVTTVDYGRDPKVGLYLAMEYVEGPALAGLRLSLERWLTPPEVYPLALDIARGLAAIHAGGIVHRDLTPLNVLVPMVDGRRMAKIIDFSHATSLVGPRLHRGAPGRLTAPHETPGTPGYMAPEQAGMAYPTAAMDIFTYGVTIWELFARRPAFAPQEPGDYQVMQRTRPVAPPALRDVATGLPDAVCNLIDRCTSVEPNLRPSATEIVAALEPLVSPPPQPSGSSPKVTLPPPEPEPEQRSWALIVGLALAVFVLCGLALGVGLLLGDTQNEPDAPTALSVGSGSSDRAIADVPLAEARAQQSTGIDAEQASESTTGGDEPGESSAATQDEHPPEEAVEDSTTPEQVRRNEAERRRAACARSTDQAREAAAKRQWSTVLSATAGNGCSRQRTQRLKLRLEALVELRRWAKCVAVADKLSSAEAKAIQKTCAAFLAKQGD